MTYAKHSRYALCLTIVSFVTSFKEWSDYKNGNTLVVQAPRYF